jgi:hypothetical protein
MIRFSPRGGSARDPSECRGSLTLRVRRATRRGRFHRTKSGAPRLDIALSPAEVTGPSRQNGRTPLVERHTFLTTTSQTRDTGVAIVVTGWWVATLPTQGGAHLSSDAGRVVIRTLVMRTWRRRRRAGHGAWRSVGRRVALTRAAHGERGRATRRGWSDQSTSNVESCEWRGRGVPTIVLPSTAAPE